MSDHRAMLVIARREFLERVRSKWFVAITLLGPIGMIALVLLPVLLTSSGEGAVVDIVDRSGVLARPLHATLSEARWKPAIVAADTPDQVELDRIRDKKINGFLAIPTDALDGGDILYLGENGANQVVTIKLGQAVHQTVLAERAKRAGIAPDKVAELTKPVTFHSKQSIGGSGTSGVGSYWLGYALAYLLLLVTTIYAVGVMRSVVQEKTSRVMELMVASVKPRALMAGKIFGVGTAGLVQFGVWLVIGAVMLAYRDQILGLFGSSAGDSVLPELHLVEVVIALLYFLLGYFFYASMYAAVGAMASSEQDTQQVQMPILLLLIVGFAFIQTVSSDPRGFNAVIVTNLPFWSSLLMPMRYLLGGASLGEVAVSLGILVASTLLVARAAGKIYRVGVLMYGKRPRLSEVVRWLRY